MKKYLASFLAISLISVSSFAMEHTGNKENNPEHKISPYLNNVKTHSIINNSGKKTGNVIIQEASGGILIEIKAEGLPAGKHGMHFHSVANCGDLEGFKTTKGHIMPEGKPHGFLNPEGPHAGNLPNLIVTENGKAHVELYSNILTYKGPTNSLYDSDGSALIIHINRDDHFTQPIGGSGSRIACSEIK